MNAAILLGNRSLPLVDRTLKNRTKLVWSILIAHEQTHLRKTTRCSVWSQHFCEKSPSPRDEEKSVDLSSVFFLSSEPKAFALSKLSSTNEMLSCRQRAASARCEATAPSLRRARWNP